MTEVRLTGRWIANAAQGRLVGGTADAVPTRIVTDTRTLQAGDLFVAIRGERYDGHGFLADAFTRGALGVLVDRAWVQGHSDEVAKWKASAGAPFVVEVSDTVLALQDLARAIRGSVDTKVVAITGSAGKTTTKETIAAFLSTRFRVVKNEGNLNNHIGLPLSLVQLRSNPDVAVMELGMNHAGEIRTLVSIADPEVRVWTNVGDAHLGFFESPDAIADAKAEILERAERDDLLVCNADDPRVVSRARRFVGRVTTFGVAADATVRASDIVDRGVDGMRARFSTSAGEHTVETPLLGRGNLANVLAATAVALHFDVPLDTIATRAATLAPASRRGAVRRLSSGVTLIDDSYNSSPSALRRALEVVSNEARFSRRVAVLGEMLELGEHAARLHQECGRVAAGAGLDALIAIGGESARALADAAVAAGMPSSAVSYFQTSDTAAANVPRYVRRGDLVLVKGSRGTRTDVVADRIVAELG